MRRLDGASTFLLLREEPGVYQHTLKIGVFDTREVPGGFGIDYLREQMRHRLQLVPICRWKVLRVPLGLHRPVWVDDPDFDIDYHLRHVMCPAPGDARAFCALVAQLYAYPLDPSRPLWLSWLIEGLAGGEVALVTLLHHAYTDGMGAARMMEQVFTAEPSAELPPLVPWKPERTPGKLRLVLEALRDLPLAFVTAAPRIARGLREGRRYRKQVAEGAHGAAPDPYRDSRDSPFNILLGPCRTFAFETFDVARIHAATQRFGVTVNDLFLALVADVYRQFMIARGYDADAGPLLATIPMQQRPPPERDDTVGNMTSADYLWLPTHIADPLERLRFAHRSSVEMKAHFASIAGADPLSIMEILPLPLFLLPDWIVKHRKSAIGQNANALVSNVRGPARPLHLGQMRMTNWISIGQVLQGMGINTTAWTYAGNFNLCIMADKRLLPDGWGMMQHFRESLERYQELALQCEQPIVAPTTARPVAASAAAPIATEAH